MTFKDVLLKNFRFNIRKYYAYFMCSSFCAAVIFMYANLFSSSMFREQELQQHVFFITFSFIFLITFSLFFIGYVHFIFMKSRNKEFGLLLTLGMTKKEINKIILFENVIIVLSSLIFGTIGGSTFSRLFSMVMIKILGFKEINYTLSLGSYFLTFGVFIVIFAVIISITLIFTNKLEIHQFFKKKIRSKRRTMRYAFLGAVGIIFTISSPFVFFLILKYDVPGRLPLYSCLYIILILVCLIGIYFSIMCFGSIIINSTKRRRKTYYANIVNLSEVNYKFTEYSKVLYIVCLLSIGVVAFNGHSFSTYNTMKEEILKKHPYDIMYIERGNDKKLKEEELNDIVKRHNVVLLDKKDIEFIELTLMKNYNDSFKVWTNNMTVLSQKEVNKAFNINVNVKRGQVISCLINKEINNWIKEGELLILKNNTTSKSYKFKLQDEIYKTIINNDYISIILNDEDYNNILKNLDKSSAATAHLLKFNDWRNTKNIFEELKIKFKQVNPNVDNFVLKNIDKRFDSKVLEYEHLMNQNKSYLFATLFIGILCFIAVGIVLYFKIFTDLEDEKIKYKKLFKIGITDKEMKKIISKELALIFFVPVFLGTFLGYGFVAFILVNSMFYGKLLLNTLKVVLVYFIIHSIFYLIARRKYISEIMADLFF